MAKKYTVKDLNPNKGMGKVVSETRKATKIPLQMIAPVEWLVFKADMNGPLPGHPTLAKNVLKLKGKR